MKFAILIVTPSNYVHSQAFNEVATTLHCGLTTLGYESVITKVPFPDRFNIILGCNLLPNCAINLPVNSVLYNLEQVSVDSSWITSELIEIFRKYPVWDYSEKNINSFSKMGIKNVQFLPIGYVPELSRISPAEQDIDVLFYGSINERRNNIIEQLRSKGLNIQVIHGVYGSQRDQFIARSKIIINIHFYAAKIFEIVRISYLLANSKFVISEIGPDSEDQDYFRDGLILTQYDDLTSTCLEYLNKSDDRHKIAQKGFQLISKRSIDQLLKKSITHLQSTYVNKQNKSDNLQPLKIDIGCGNKKHKGFIGVDIYPAQNVDIVADLSRNFPFNNNSIDQIIANDFIEHLIDRIHTMNEIWRVCKPNALVDIFVPSSDGRGAFQDPTHVSFWNINSFQYYCSEYPDYLNLCQQYGFQGEFSLVRLDHYKAPGNVIHVRAILRAIKNSDASPAQISIESLHLKDTNLIIFPDWQESNEIIFNNLKDIFIELFKHPERSDINLIIESSSFHTEDGSEVEDFLSYLAMDLSFSNGINIEEAGIDISILDDLDETTWKLLSTSINARIILTSENVELIKQLGISGITSLNSDNIQSHSFQTTQQSKPQKFWLANHIKDTRITIGDYTYADGPVNFVLVNSDDKISIGKFCSIASGVTIFGGGEYFLERVTTYPLKVLLTQIDTDQGNVDATTKGNTTIGNDVWIGQGATLLSGVKIGNGVVIGAKAVVAKDIPDYAVVVGNPAQIIRYRFSEATIETLSAQQWWNWEISKILANIDLLYQNPEDGFMQRQ